MPLPESKHQQKMREALERIAALPPANSMSHVTTLAENLNTARAIARAALSL